MTERPENFQPTRFENVTACEELQHNLSWKPHHVYPIDHDRKLKSLAVVFVPGIYRTRNRAGVWTTFFVYNGDKDATAMGRDAKVIWFELFREWVATEHNYAWPMPELLGDL